MKQRLMMAQGRLRPHRHNVREGGLEGIIKGLEDLEQGRIRAEKLVYTISQEDRS